MSVPKKKRNMKELNKKATGDLLDAFKEVCFCLHRSIFKSPDSD